MNQVVSPQRSLGAQQKQSGNKKHGFWRWFLVLDLVLLLIGGGAKAARAWRWQRVLQNDVAALRALLQDAPGAMPHSPAELLTFIHNDLQGVQSEFALLLKIAPHLHWLPRYGADLAAAPALLTMALELSEHGARLAQALEPLLVPQHNAPSPTLETALVLLLSLIHI